MTQITVPSFRRVSCAGADLLTAFLVGRPRPAYGNSRLIRNTNIANFHMQIRKCLEVDH